MTENNDEQTDGPTREELEAKLAEAEEQIAAAEREKQRQDELTKFEAKKHAPPKLTGTRRSKLDYNEKKRIIQEFGVSVYDQLPL